MILPILTVPNPFLRQKAQEINPEKIKSPEIQRLIFDMKETIKPAGGIGLAAPQVGFSLRLIVISLPGKEMITLINPEITRFSWLKEVEEEGCLSVPGKFGFVKRSKVIQVKVLNENGKLVKIKARGLFARVIQHEIDHLDGILFIDRIKKIFENSQVKF